ncbi:hypothetical protein SUDANB70_04332 [Streptomyces sp. enrichment culture]
MKADDPLLRILACPLDKGPLDLLAADTDREEALYNPRLRRRYPIVDGIPQLLPSSGEQVSAEEHEKLLLTRVTAGGDAGGPGDGDAGEAAGPGDGGPDDGTGARPGAAP